MSGSRPPPGSIPTLTEVVSWPAVASPAAAAAPAVVPALAASPVPVPAPAPIAAPALAVAHAPAARAIDEAELRQRVLADIQKQVDLMLEVRLREAMAPALGRATDALVRDARKELTSTLRDIVAQAVARELASRDGR